MHNKVEKSRGLVCGNVCVCEKLMIFYICDHFEDFTLRKNLSPYRTYAVIIIPENVSHVLCVDTGRSSETAKAHRG
eukprot:TRINITY_DN994_c1_g1_i1.p1 TRINITY_DN994_c1_g1~~TRINITY_DN994_c1_g1_i1.p1  ORF type:complete len:76 (+),score=9.51 TRINITY_DN994_c1_g1_i1:281-508(+)